MLRSIVVFFLMIILVFSCTMDDPQKIDTSNEKTQSSIKKSDDSNKEISFCAELFAFITMVDQSQSINSIQADTINYFTGKLAADEYFKDHSRKLDETTFYIRNSYIDSIRYLISDSIQIKLKTFDHSVDGNYDSSQLGNFDKFCELYNSVDKSYISQLPFKLQIVKNEVISIEEIYIP